MQRNHFFEGTASELIEKLKNICDETFYPNRVTRELILNGYELEKQGIKFEYKRTHRGRKIILQTLEKAERDGSDSKNTAVTTVALPPVKSLSSPYNARSTGRVSNNLSSGSSVTPIVTVTLRSLSAPPEKPLSGDLDNILKVKKYILKRSGHSNADFFEI